MTAQHDRVRAPHLGRGISVEQAEWAVLAGLMEYPDRLHEVAALVTLHDWTTVGRAQMYGVILAEAAAGRPPNSIDTPLALFRQVDEANMGQLMDHAIRYTPATSADLVRHAERVADAALERRIRDQLRAGIDEIETTLDVAATAQGVASSLLVLAERQTATDGTADDLVTASLERAHLRSIGEIEAGISTGIADVDACLRLERGRMYVVAARPGMGKSAFGGHLIRSDRGAHRWGVISLEMEGVDWFDRLICAEARVDVGRYLRGEISDLDAERVLDASERVRRWKVKVDARPGLRLAQVVGKARQWAMTGGLDALIVDYVGLIRKDNPRTSPYEHVTEVSQGLQGLAKELRIPVVALCQLSRDCEKRPDKRPVPSDLRDSGSLEQDAYAILMLYRDAVYNEDADPRDAEVLVRKNRGGPTGPGRALWYGEHCRFESVGECR